MIANGKSSRQVWSLWQFTPLRSVQRTDIYQLGTDPHVIKTCILKLAQCKSSFCFAKFDSQCIRITRSVKIDMPRICPWLTESKLMWWGEGGVNNKNLHFSHSPQVILMHTYKNLEQESAKFSCKEPDSNYFSLCGTRSKLKDITQVLI